MLIEAIRTRPTYRQRVIMLFHSFHSTAKEAHTRSKLRYEFFFIKYPLNKHDIQSHKKTLLTELSIESYISTRKIIEYSVTNSKTFH